MRAAAPRRALGLAAALGLPACGAGTFVCSDASDCVGAGVDGVCQEDGFCSFPDDVCPSGQRYGSHSGSLAGECVPTDGGTTTDETPSTDTTTHAGTSTADPVTTLPLDASATDDGTTSSPTDPTDASTSSAPDSSDDGSTVDPDLLVWLSFDDGALANEGALGGAASCIDEQCPETMLGVLGDAMRFDGSDDCLSFASSVELETMDQLTVAAWVRIDVEAMHYGLVDKPIGPGMNNSWALYYYPTERETVQLFAMTNGLVGGHLESAPLQLGEWVYLAATWDGMQMALFVDGVLMTSDVAPEIAFDEQPVLVGCDNDHIGAELNGQLAGAMDDVRIYARALDGDEIASLAQRSP